MAVLLPRPLPTLSRKRPERAQVVRVRLNRQARQILVDPELDDSAAGVQDPLRSPTARHRKLTVI